eukprot:TRINITY_DN12075_c0_g1_i1.p1 TRINITY_DN12075_c0_g1~~TRINITY_DN12075_c0_g1_i1.p1  ORF type:complete len:283 (+),score=77.80 TRINITY_DN12075_c0_g1_i1:57-905(+)
MGEPMLTRLQRALAAYRRPMGQPRPRQASVACILRGQDDLEMLFIVRAARDGDRWSGQVAFPGGKREGSDDSLQITAERETLEEIGLDLRDGFTCLGRSADRTANKKLSVACFVYHQTALATPALKLSEDEVGDVAWVKVKDLVDPKRFTDVRWAGEGVSSKVFAPLRMLGVTAMHFHAVDLGCGAAGRPFILWGLTLRMVGDLLAIAGVGHPHLLAAPIYRFAGPMGWANNAVMRATHVVASALLRRPLSWDTGMKLHILVMGAVFAGGLTCTVRSVRAKM